ncbi:MAG TPA: type II toxin-antitoxin system RelE/ParE family toxin [Candidatus Saccharimonadales bacterium]|nr:type II toxin-antitoxin system RelE/ParE family toxin [Candidatus Saccharimonadales bacterium]
MKVVFLPAADQDLSALFLYIQNELQNPIAARNIATKILQRSQSLEEFPEIGTSLESVARQLSGYRHLLVDNYLVIYKVTNSQVIIIRILYARSDYVQLLRS